MRPWDHEGPCRWPHHSAIDDARDQARLLTVFAVVPDDEGEVRERIVAALASHPGWIVTGVRDAVLPDDETELGRRLCHQSGPRRPDPL